MRLPYARGVFTNMQCGRRAELVGDLLEDAPRISAEDAIRKAREQVSVRQVSADR